MWHKEYHETRDQVADAKALLDITNTLGDGCCKMFRIINSEVKQRKVTVHRKHSRLTEKARTKEVILTNNAERGFYNIGSRKHGDYTNMRMLALKSYIHATGKMKCQMDYMESIKKLEEKWMSNEPRDGNNGYSNGNRGGK
ncbi:hypothetical protein Tco_1432048, partial [Tanacetum coccineum]